MSPETVIEGLSLLASALVGALAFSWRSGAAYRELKIDLRYVREEVDKIEKRLDTMEQRLLWQRRAGG